MNQSVAIKSIAVAIGVFTLILSPDLCYWVIHSIVVGLFELLEGVLDTIVEGLLHTGRHTTQVIVFYLMWGMFFYLAHKLQHYLKNRIRQTVTTIPQWRFNKWRERPLSKKVQLISGCFLGTLCFAFLL